MNTDKFINKQGTLFSEEEYLLRNTAEREAVKGTITPLAALILNKIEEAEYTYHQYACQHNLARQLNNFVSTNLTSLIIESLSHIEGITLCELSKGNIVLSVANYKIWVKKVDKKLMPKFNNTKASLKRMNQYVEGDDYTPMLILGYQLSDAQTIIGIFLEYLKGSEHLWTPIDVGDIGARQLKANDINISPSQPENLEIRVKPSLKKGMKKAE